MLSLIRQNKKFSWWVGILVVAGFLFSSVSVYGHAFDEGDHGHMPSIAQTLDENGINQDVEADQEPLKSSEEALDHDCAVVACMAMILPPVDLNSISVPMADWNLRIPMLHEPQTTKPPYHPPILT